MVTTVILAYKASFTQGISMHSLCEGHVDPHGNAHVFCASLRRQPHWFLLGCSSCHRHSHFNQSEIRACPWTHTLSASRAGHALKCQTGSSDCVCGAAASHQTSIGLQAWGCIKHLHIPMQEKHGLHIGYPLIHPLWTRPSTPSQTFFTVFDSTIFWLSSNSLWLLLFIVT